jgi:hypothetical protein
MWRLGTKLRLLLILLLLGSSGCVTAPQPSSYRVQIPILQARPTDYQVAEGEWMRCYRRDDALQLVIELKTACLALGGTPEECQTEKKQQNSQ